MGILQIYRNSFISVVEMTKHEAIEFYKTQVNLAAALGISQSSVAEWGEYPPAIRQMQLERITRGRLRAERDVLLPKKRAKAA
jgi:hypothetical protein